MDRVKTLGMAAKEFAHEYKDCMVIIADAKTDYLLAAYQDSYIYGQVKSVHGIKMRVVKEAIKASKFKNSMSTAGSLRMRVDMILSSLSELLWLPFDKAQEMYKFIYDAFYHLPKGPTLDTPEPSSIMKTKESKKPSKHNG